MIFSNIKDIGIPEGNVVKIHETLSGRVLWQKKTLNPVLNPSWSSISAAGISGNLDNASILCSGNMTDYYNSGFNMRTFIEYKSQGKRTMSPYVSKRGNVFYVSGAYGTYGNAPAQVSYSQNLTYSMSDDGKVMFGHNGSSYYLYSMNGANNSGNELKTKSPVSETSVVITHSPERNEYLICGIQGGTFTIPENFSSLSSISQSNKNLAGSVWVAPLNSYFGFTGNNRYVMSSEDGYSWNQSLAFSSGNVSGIAYMTSKGLLCVLNASKDKIAVSPDGLTWNEIDVPFSNPAACSCSPEPGLLCVLTSNAAYMSYDLVNWVNAPVPGNKSVSFRELFHIRNGIFGAYAYKANVLYILSAVEQVIIDE